ncbi:MAG: nitroreductase, partial [Pseudomonadota bacterium]
TEAARAPSGSNTQPWRVVCVSGPARDRVSAAVLAAARAGEGSKEYDYMPAPLGEPYMARKRAVGFELYRLLGVAREDRAGRAEAMLRNFTFFGAPVGLFFTMERRLTYGSWLDMGIFLQSVMTVARAHGLETCPQQSWCEFGAAVRAATGIEDEALLLCGMALGHADPEAPENGLESAREPLDGFARFLTE